MTAPDIFKMKHSGDQITFEAIQQNLSTTHFLVQVGPKMTLSRNNVLQWVLKKLVMDDGHSVTTCEHGNNSTTESENASLIDTTDESVCKLKSLQASECEAEHVQPLKADAIPTQIEDVPGDITGQSITKTNNARQTEIGKDLLLKSEHVVLHD
ncbi:hypothetical protein RND81_13G016500 [Saponaria officinalis]|uniref:Uncharacterized protein n=1 Tax=Saponaria officinalis TaxID=3572 RepID=A0AAW1H1H5_SAPOF